MTSLRPLVLAVSLVPLASACDGCDKKHENGAAASASAAQSAKPPPAPVASVPPEDKSQVGLITMWRAMGLAQPETVIHDELADVYFVSNIDGKPLEADGKAFISKLEPDAVGATIKWIESGKNGVRLNAPKGMALTGNTLWVADIDTVRTFDRLSGKPIAEIKVPGAKFLNGMAVNDDGRVLVSDSGNDSDAVYLIDGKKTVTTLAKGKELGGPNGMFQVGKKTWVVTLGSNELYTLNFEGTKGSTQKLPKGMLDGIAFVGDDVLVSSWEAKAIYRGKPGGELKAVLEDVKSPAGILYDKKRSRLIVPLLEENEIRAYNTPEPPPPPPPPAPPPSAAPSAAPAE